MSKDKRSITPFGQKCKKRLIELNMTQKELADILGVKKQYITDVFRGARSGEKYIEKIEEILELNKADKIRLREVI